MIIVRITPQNFEKYRYKMLSFVKRFSNDAGDYKWLFHLTKHHFNCGTKIILALWNGKIISLIAFSKCGKEKSVYIFSPQYHHPAISLKLHEIAKKELGQIF